MDQRDPRRDEQAETEALPGVSSPLRPTEWARAEWIEENRHKFLRKLL